MLPDVEWSTDHLPDEVEIIEMDPNDIIVSDRTPEEARERLGETFSGNETIELQPIPVKPVKGYSDRSWTKQIDVSRAYILLCIAKDIPVKVERATHLFTYKDTYHIPDDKNYHVWFATMYDLDEDHQYDTLLEQLKTETKPDYIKRTWPGEIAVDSNKETIWERDDYRTGRVIETPDDALDVAKDMFEPEWRKERSGLIFLDKNNNVLRTKIMNVGDESSTHVPPATSINRLADKYGAAKVIYIHNHPRGEARPSSNDKKSYKQMKRGNTGLFTDNLDVELWDSLIVKTGYRNRDTIPDTFYSFRRSFDKRDLENHLEEPIKVSWSGKARDKVRHFAEHWLEKGFHEERSQHLITVLDRESTNLVITNTDEAEAFLTTLAASFERNVDGERELHNTVFKFDGRLHQAGQRVRDAIIEQLEQREYVVEGSVVKHKY